MLSRIAAGLIVYGITTLIKNRTNSSDPIRNEIFKTIGNGQSQFYIDENLSSIIAIEDEYQYYDIRPTDMVLDIGACIGAFALKVAPLVKKVYAIEPLFIENLERNIQLNNIKNITALDCALGNGPICINYNNRKTSKFGLSLGEITNICGGHIDFLKCDCEGAEIFITPPEIQNIRRLEMEIHDFNNNNNFRDFEDILTSTGFDYIKRFTDKNTMLISAKNRNIL